MKTKIKFKTEESTLYTIQQSYLFGAVHVTGMIDTTDLIALHTERHCIRSTHL